MLLCNTISDLVGYPVFLYRYLRIMFTIGCLQSLAVGRAEIEGLSCITTLIPGTDESIGQLVQQFHKLVDVHEVRFCFSFNDFKFLEN